MAYRSIFGRKVGVDENGMLLAREGLAVGRPAIPLPSPVHVAWFDDFIGDTLNPTYAPLVGTDVSGNVPSVALLSNSQNGIVRLAGGDSAGTMAADGAQLVMGSRHWRADAGGLVFEARVKLAVITNVSVFVGFTDKFTLEAPVISAASADTITTNANDAVGFMFDTSMATDNWWAVGSANNVDAVSQNLGVAPVVGTYETLRVEVSKTGAATFYRNGVPIGAQMNGAITPGTLLTPSLSIFPRTAAFGTQLDCDYLAASVRRV